jgi:hypothetical protein
MLADQPPQHGHEAGGELREVEHARPHHLAARERE